MKKLILNQVGAAFLLMAIYFNGLHMKVDLRLLLPIDVLIGVVITLFSVIRGKQIFGGAMVPTIVGFVVAIVNVQMKFPPDLGFWYLVALGLLAVATSSYMVGDCKEGKAFALTWRKTFPVYVVSATIMYAVFLYGTKWYG